jgi:hypothetical protein
MLSAFDHILWEDWYSILKLLGEKRTLKYYIIHFRRVQREEIIIRISFINITNKL